MIVVVMTIFVFIFLPICLYLLLLTTLAGTVRISTTFGAKVSHRFAFVVPAYNEEGSIQNTIESLKAQEYPADRFEVFVVADNCSDSTADRSRAMGVSVLERRDPSKRGKGFALRWAFDQLLEHRPSYDAFVIVDADSIASSTFLRVMNLYFERGSRALQGSDLVNPGAHGWNAQMTRIGFMLYNYVRPLGRRVLGGSAGLRGNGMCIGAAVLREFPWNAYSIGEDLEYGLQLLLHDVIVDFAPEAVVLATMPAIAKNAETQRTRWERGRFGLILKYMGPLLQKFLHRPSIAVLDAFLDLITPALVNLVTFTLGMSLVALGLAALGVVYMIWFAGFWILLAVMCLVHLLVGLKIAHADPDVFRMLLSIPRFAVWKLQVYCRLPRRWRTNEWVRTTRENS